MSNTKRVVIVCAPGFEDIETVAPIDVCTRIGVEVVVAGTEPGPLAAAYGTRLVTDCSVEDIDPSTFDGIICPGGKANAKALAANSQVVSLVRTFAKEQKLVAAICAAPSHVLGEGANILAGRRATGDPGFNDKLKASGAEVVDQEVCLDGAILTATGPGSALSFALSCGAWLLGPEAVQGFSEKWNVPFVAA